MKKILVVGGGIVGMTSAYFAKQASNQVVLIEAGKTLGGLLKSECSEYGYFDYGTHIASKTGVPDLDNFLFSHFNKENSYLFNVGKSGNFFKGKLSDISPFVNTNHLPKGIYEKGCVELLATNNEIGCNLKETLINRYGDIFYQNIFKDLVYKIFGCDANQLANECLPFFDMSRVLAFDVETSKQAKKDFFLDEKIGFHTFIEGVDKLYPQTGGIGRWIENLEEKLINHSVDIKTQSQITQIEVKPDGFLVCFNNEMLEVDELVWTLSSGLLNRFISTGIGANKPDFRKTGIYDFVFDEPLKTESYYINVYDGNLLSNRITCYQNLQEKRNFYACSVEVLHEDDFDFEKKIKHIEKELTEVGIIEENSKCIFSQCRVLQEGFPRLTSEAVGSLKKLNTYYKHNHKNITLLGRSSAKGFFMSDLLISAYHEMKNE